MKNKLVRQLFFAIFFCTPMILNAEEKEQLESPSLEFLEFIGSWSTEHSDDWVDPFALKNVNLETSTVEKTEDNTND